MIRTVYLDCVAIVTEQLPWETDGWEDGVDPESRGGVHRAGVVCTVDGARVPHHAPSAPVPASL